METEKIGIKPFLISLAAIFIIESTSASVVSTGISLTAMLWINRMLEIAFLILIVWVWGNGLTSIGLEFYQVYPGLKKGLIWSLGFGILVSIGFGITFFIGKNPLTFFHARLPHRITDLIFFFLLRGLVGPVAEEIFFRGILYGFLRKWGIFTAILLTNLIFVFIHPTAGFIQAVGGVLFTVSYEVEKKLMVPIVIHVLGNTAILGLALLNS